MPILACLVLQLSSGSDILGKIGGVCTSSVFWCLCAFNCPLIEASRCRFPLDEQLKQLWVNNMGTSALEPEVDGMLCAEHFEPECFTDGRLEELRGDAIPTVFDFPAATAQATAPVANKPPSLLKRKLVDIKTTYLKHNLEKPVTVTLPPSSRLVLIPTKPHLEQHRSSRSTTVPIAKESPHSHFSAVSTVAMCSSVQNDLVLNDDVDTTVAPQDLSDQRSIVQPITQLRTSKLAKATQELSKAKRAYATCRRKQKTLNDLLFVERTLERNGKKVIEISLSQLALEVLEIQPTDAANNHIEEGSCALDHVLQNEAGSHKNGEQLMSESQ